MSKIIEIDPAMFGKMLFSCGFTESEIQDLFSAFRINGNRLDEESILSQFLAMGKELPDILVIFSKLGIGRAKVSRMVERKQIDKIRASADIYLLEVDV